MRSVLWMAAWTLLCGTVLAGENWTQFRGPNGDGRADDAQLPLTWSETENIRWKTPIHDKGWSSPVVWGDQIWMTTATEDGHQLFVVCVDLKSGKILHDRKLYDVAEPGFCPDMNSYASPTPVIEAGRVYVHFGSYGTACLDTATAETIWSRRDLECDHYRAPGSSPIVYGNLLILQFDGYDRQYVAALDKNTGKTVWLSDRDVNYGTDNGDLKKAFSTPSVFEFAGRPLLISPTAMATLAYDVRTGEEVWKVRSGGMNAAARPLAGHGLVFANSGHRGWQMFAVKPAGKGDVSDTHVVWKYSKTVPSRSSQLLVDDLLYMVSDNGVATALEAKTGEVVWQQRLGENYCASPIHADGRIYFFSQEGSTSVLRAGREAEILAVNRLNDGCMASPAAVGDELILRTRTYLYCIAE